MSYEGGPGSGSLNATEIAVGSLLAGGYGGRGGYGGGGGAWGGGGYGGYGPFSSPSSNAVRIDRNNEALHDQAQHNDTNRICDRLSDGFRDVAGAGFQGELRTNDRLRDIEREMNQNARSAADCCCEIKTEVLRGHAALSQQLSESEGRLALNQCKDTAAIIAEIKAVEGREVERALNAANAELTALKTQVACGCNCGHGHHGGGGRRNP